MPTISDNLGTPHICRERNGGGGTSGGKPAPYRLFEYILIGETTSPPEIIYWQYIYETITLLADEFRNVQDAITQALTISDVVTGNQYSVILQASVDEVFAFAAAALTTLQADQTETFHFVAKSTSNTDKELENSIIFSDTVSSVQHQTQNETLILGDIQDSDVSGLVPETLLLDLNQYTLTSRNPDLTEVGITDQVTAVTKPLTRQGLRLVETIVANVKNVRLTNTLRFTREVIKRIYPVWMTETFQANGGQPVNPNAISGDESFTFPPESVVVTGDLTDEIWGNKAYSQGVLGAASPTGVRLTFNEPDISVLPPSDFGVSFPFTSHTSNPSVTYKHKIFPRWSDGFFKSATNYGPYQAVAYSYGALITMPGLSTGDGSRVWWILFSHPGQTNANETSTISKQLITTTNDFYARIEIDRNNKFASTGWRPVGIGLHTSQQLFSFGMSHNFMYKKLGSTEGIVRYGPPATVVQGMQAFLGSGQATTLAPNVEYLNNNTIYCTISIESQVGKVRFGLADGTTYVQQSFTLTPTQRVYGLSLIQGDGTLGYQEPVTFSNVFMSGYRPVPTATPGPQFP